MTTKLVNISKGFTLTLQREGRVEKFPIVPGVQYLDAEVADHPYTRAHTEPLPAAVESSTGEAAVELAAKRSELAAVEAALQGQEADLAARELALTTRATQVDDRDAALTQRETELAARVEEADARHAALTERETAVAAAEKKLAKPAGRGG